MAQRPPNWKNMTAEEKNRWTQKAAAKAMGVKTVKQAQREAESKKAAMALDLTKEVAEAPKAAVVVKPKPKGLVRTIKGRNKRLKEIVDGI